MAPKKMAPSSDNSVSGEEIDRVLGSTHDLVEAVHAGCDICTQLRNVGERVRSEASSEAILDFQHLLEGFSKAKEKFLRARSSGQWLPDYDSAFDWAARFGHIVIVQFLLGVDPKPDGEAKGKALKLAARFGHIVIVQFLLGVDPKPDSEAKGKALELAAQEGHSHVVEALLDVLDVDPRVGVHDIIGVLSAALSKVASYGHGGVVEAVLEYPKVNVMELAGAHGCISFHDTASSGHTGVVEVLLRHPEFDANRRQPIWGTPLHRADKEGLIGVVEVLLKHPSVDVNAADDEGSTPLHVVVCLARLNAIYYSDIAKWRRCIKMEDEYLEDLRQLFSHVWYGNIPKRNYGEIVELFAKHIDRQKIYQENNYSKTALEYAYESKDVSIWQVLSQVESTKAYIEGLFKDRQVYVDAANAILVGAALIASVTLGSWLQPPLSYTFEGDGYSSQSSPSMPKYVDVEHNVALRVFWMFNCFSFYFAMATVVIGACSVLRRRKLFIKKIVQKLRRYLIGTSILLGCSVLCDIVAFGISGSIVLAPMLKYQSVMIVPTTIGGLICLISLGILFKNIVEDMELKDLQICLPRCFRKHKRDG